MGLFRKIASVLSGSSEADLVNAKREIQYKADKAIYKKEAEAVEQMVLKSYEEAVGKIICRLGNAARHHAGLISANNFKTSPFLERFTEHYALEIFTKGVSLGHQAASGTADSKFQEEIGLLLDQINKRMVAEARQSSFTQIEAECFTIAGHTAFELGVQAGQSFADQEYLVIPK
ncbi:hypothetical protein SAMN05877753_101574 [Bacillus oleivorans]|uniref:Uncharacterized protein n=1 Tax=Bacillus oleivorans TaxID=1448271 RepID=A0A285CIS8_9BACI|nr:hypothetical protein [Bacillus oleivorans]SNX67255.1 hypothetical protein SAMN05877753_101574 [Bacillus oleivorans]